MHSDELHAAAARTARDHNTAAAPALQADHDGAMRTVSQLEHDHSMRDGDQPVQGIMATLCLLMAGIALTSATHRFITCAGDASGQANRNLDYCS
jgi:hypothetical protein